VREERPGDVEPVDGVLRRAFGGAGEADLVRALRGRVQPCLALVAEEDGEVAGHVLFTPVRVGADATALALGPMAVDPPRQNRGLGSALVRTGLARCRAAGHDVVFVLGHTRFYPRLGFRPAAPVGLWWKRPDIGPAFMVAELRAGALDGLEGEVRYDPAFDAL